MAIVKMRKLNLIAMTCDKDAVLDALQRTNAAEITLHPDTEHTEIPIFDTEETRSYCSSVEAALECLCSAVDKYGREHGDKSPVIKDESTLSVSLLSVLWQATHTSTLSPSVRKIS